MIFIIMLCCRVVRQIFQCLKYIIDVMLVLFFLIAVFALVGESNSPKNI